LKIDDLRLTMTDRRPPIVNHQSSIMSPVASNKKVGFRPLMSFDLFEYRLFIHKKQEKQRAGTDAPVNATGRTPYNLGIHFTQVTTTGWGQERFASGPLTIGL